MADPASTPLCNAIEHLFDDRPFTLRFWDGGEVACDPPGPTLTFRSPARSDTSCARPASSGIGRAYVKGEIDVDDLDGVVALLGRWHGPRAGPGRRAWARRRARAAPPASAASPSPRPS